MATTPGVSPIIAPALFFCAVAASAILTALARHYALRRQLLDQPGQRRSHVSPTPRGGGIGPVLVLLAGGAVLAGIDPASRQSLVVCLAGLAAVAGVGWMDDHRPLPASLRLCVHLGAGLAASLVLIGPPQTMQECCVVVASTVIVAGLANTWNFMDGIDGIATSQAGLVALILIVGSCFPALMPDGSWLAGGWFLFALLLLAATLGFLPFNVPRARIFLGDVGSGALGFAIACLLLRAVATHAMAWPLAALPVSAFLIDAGLTLAVRFARGKKWWRPHREHLYQWLVRSGHTHLDVARCYALWTLFAGALAVALSKQGSAVGASLSAVAILCGSFFWMWLRNRLWIAARHRH